MSVITDIKENLSANKRIIVVDAAELYRITEAMLVIANNTDFIDHGTRVELELDKIAISDIINGQGIFSSTVERSGDVVTNLVGKCEEYMEKLKNEAEKEDAEERYVAAYEECAGWLLM